jgi:L,D-transpeptidase-like protein
MSGRARGRLAPSAALVTLLPPAALALAGASSCGGASPLAGGGASSLAGGGATGVEARREGARPAPSAGGAAEKAAGQHGLEAAPGGPRGASSGGLGAAPGGLGSASGGVGVTSSAGLGRASAEPAAGEATGPRAVGLSYPAWVYPRPGRGQEPIGVVRPGTSIALRSDKTRPGGACAGGWVEAGAGGFLCNNETISLDANHPMAAAPIAALVRPSGEGVLPYRYAFSRGAPMYGRLPTEAEQEKVEGPAGRRPRARKPEGGFGGHDELAVEDAIEAEGEAPAWLAGGEPLPTPKGPAPLVRKWVPDGSAIAFTRAFKAGGRTWLVSSDLSLVPADRVLAYRVSGFRGVKLEGELRLPIAWARRTARPFYKREAGGWVPTGERLAARASVALTGERVEGARGAFLKVAGEGEAYVAEGDVAVARPRKPPAGVGEAEKWIDVRLREGTLVAYEGARPVFATLVSGGAGGAGAPGDSNRELVRKSATPVGSYRVSWKVWSARMTPETGEPRRFWLAEVPYTLYFRPPFAIHTAYWHEGFGEPKSAGCVNVSPADGKFLFGWADPPLPEGFQGVGPGRATGPGTRLVIAP